MGEPIIDDVVSEQFVAPETGRPLTSGIRSLVISPSLEGREADLVRGLKVPGRIAVVSDENTHAVLGSRVATALGDVDEIVLDHPKADEDRAANLAHKARHADLLVAVGSGTLNDLCKYVTHKTGRSCAVFATAPSMDGYVTSTVSIARDGFKYSLPAHSPRGVFFDLSVAAAAPHG